MLYEPYILDPASRCAFLFQGAILQFYFEKVQGLTNLKKAVCVKPKMRLFRFTCYYECIMSLRTYTDLRTRIYYSIIVKRNVPHIYLL